MKKVLSYVLFLCVFLLGNFFVGGHLVQAGTVMPSSNEQSLTVDISEVAPASGLGAWQKEGAPNSTQDKLWQEGTSADELIRQKNPAAAARARAEAAKKKGTVGPQPSPALPVQEDEEGMTLAGGSIRGDSEVVGSSWNSSTSQEPVLDEDMLKEQHDVVGAYGQVIDDDDFKMRVGPELYIPSSGASLLGGDKQDNSELGMSMKFQWGF